MVAQFVVFVFSFAQFSEKISKEICVKTVNVIIKKPIDNNFPWSSVIEVRNDVKMLKRYAVKLLASDSWFH